MVQWGLQHAFLLVIVFWTADMLGVNCVEHLFGGEGEDEKTPAQDVSSLNADVDLMKEKRKSQMAIFKELIKKKEIEEELLNTALDSEFHGEEVRTFLPTKQYTPKLMSYEFVMKDMENKKVFKNIKCGKPLIKVLESLSYDEQYADDQEVTLYQQVFSHETSPPTIRSPKASTTRRKKTTTKVASETIGTTIPVQYEYYKSDDDRSKGCDSEPKQVTSKELPLYEYCIDVLPNNQTVHRRLYPVNGQNINGTYKALQGNELKQKRQRKMRTTTEYKVLKTEKSRQKFQKLKKKYDHLIIGKLPNITEVKEKDCLEKEIIHLFTVEDMKSYLTDLVHYYKHYRNHFNTVVNLVNNVSIFDIKTDDVHVNYTSRTSTTDVFFLNKSIDEIERRLFPSTTLRMTQYPQFPALHGFVNNDFITKKHLKEKFDLNALNNLFDNEKKVLTDADRRTYESITYNLKYIFHCLKLNLNLAKYNYLNDTHVEDVVDIIWKNRLKYDDSDYESEYEDLYEELKTVNYYSVSSRQRDEMAYEENLPSAIEEEKPYTRNLENQRMIKEALRNISHIRHERAEFEAGIMEGQLRHRCHYCGKNYTSEEHQRYQRHVYNHMVRELEGPDFEDGKFVKDRPYITAMMERMTAATKPNYATIDIGPYYEHMGSNELYYEFMPENFTTKSFDQLVAIKRKKDAKEAKLQKDLDEKKRKAMEEKELKDVRKFLDQKDLVTFSDESLPQAIKSFVSRFANTSGFSNLTHLEKFQFGSKERSKAKDPQGKSKLLGQFEQEKELEEEDRLNELKNVAHELLKRKDWRSRLNIQTTTADVHVEMREEKLKKMKKIQRKRYQQKLLKEKKQREMQQIWHQHNMDADKWVFKTNVWTTLGPQ